MEMNDYYKILELNYKYTAFGLFKNYLKKTKIALSTNNKEEFIKIRMGFEVLRAEEVVDDYNRIYRKYIMNEELNFPRTKEEEMIANYQEKEKLGTKIATKVIADNETYSFHLMKFIFEFILADLNIVWPWTWGLAVFLAGIIVLIAAIVTHHYIGLIFGPLLILWGFFYFRWHIIKTIMPMSIVNTDI